MEHLSNSKHRFNIHMKQVTQATDSGNCVKFAEILGGDGRPYSIYTNRNCKDLFASVCEGIF